MTVGATILVAIVFGAGAYLYANNQATQEKEALNTQIVALQNEVSSAKKAAEATPNSSAGATATTDATADWQTYNDTTYNFSFKYPKGLVVQPSASNNAVNYYMISINKSGDISPDGGIIGDVSGAYLQIGNSSTVNGSRAIINSSSGKIDAVYSTDVTSDAYNFYVYEFQKNGKYYAFAMNYNNDTPSIMTPDQFKQLVDTIIFN